MGFWTRYWVEALSLRVCEGFRRELSKLCKWYDPYLIEDYRVFRIQSMWCLQGTHTGPMCFWVRGLLITFLGGPWQISYQIPGRWWLSRLLTLFWSCCPYVQWNVNSYLIIISIALNSYLPTPPIRVVEVSIKWSIEKKKPEILVCINYSVHWMIQIAKWLFEYLKSQKTWENELLQNLDFSVYMFCTWPYYLSVLS